MTEWEERLIDYAIRLREARYSVEEAFLELEFKHAIDMVRKERAQKGKLPDGDGRRVDSADS